MALVISLSLAFVLSPLELKAQAPAVAPAPTAPAVAPAAEGEAVAPAAGGTSFFDVVFGGTAVDKIVWVMLFLTSLATVALIIDGVLTIKTDKIMPPQLVVLVREALNRGDLGGALDACHATPGPFANILMAGFNNVSEGFDVIMDSISAAADMENEKLMQRVNYLNVCGAVGPMLGLLGTVTGMVSAFASLATTQGAAKQAMLAISISTALYTTVVGLLISLPAILAYTFNKNTAARIILSMEGTTYDLIKVLKNAEVVEDESTQE
jgi:biopolymer transport protein ExbB